MKKVEFLISIAGADFSYYAGQITDIDAKTATVWEKSGVVKIIKEK